MSWSIKSTSRETSPKKINKLKENKIGSLGEGTRGGTEIDAKVIPGQR